MFFSDSNFAGALRIRPSGQLAARTQYENQLEADMQLNHKNHFCCQVTFCDQGCCDQVTDFVIRQALVGF